MNDSTYFEHICKLYNTCDIGISCCGKRIETPAHVHMPEAHDCYLFVLVNRGCAVLHSADDLIFQAHDLFIMVPGAEISYSALTPWSIQWVGLTGSGVTELLDPLGISETNPVIHVSLYSELENLLEQIYQECCEQSLTAKFSIMSKIFDLFSILAKCATENGKIDYMDSAVKIIDYNYNNNISISRLANQFHVSHTYFSIQFSKKTGVSPMQYIQNKRITQAKELLSQKHASIAEVAFSVGYEDPLYFSRIFKKHVGMSPSAYVSILSQK